MALVEPSVLVMFFVKTLVYLSLAILSASTAGQEYRKLDDVNLKAPYFSGTSKSSVSCVVACVSTPPCVIVAYEKDTEGCYFGQSTSSSAVLTPSPGTVVYITGPCDLGWTLIGGRCLKFVGSRSTWYDSQSHCQSLGANLVHIYSLQDLQDVISFIPCTWGSTGCGPWFGINDVTVEGQLTGSAGQSVTAEVVNSISAGNSMSKDCTYYSTNYRDFNIASCSYADSSICEQEMA